MRLGRRGGGVAVRAVKGREEEEAHNNQTGGEAGPISVVTRDSRFHSLWRWWVSRLNLGARGGGRNGA